MVTRAQAARHTLTAAALAAFGDQTFGDKELIVVISGHRAEDKLWLEKVLASLPEARTRVVEVQGDPPLAHLRNRSLSEAKGDILCQWDDDDICHPDRLARQFERLKSGNHDAVYLQDVLQYFPGRHEIYWVNWRKTEVGAHPGTLMVRRSAMSPYEIEGPCARLGEDSLIALQLKRTANVGVLESAPHLYMYVSHGSNSWDMGHHEMLADQLAVSRSFLNRREKELRQEIAGYRLPLKGAVMCGSNGAAFTLGLDDPQAEEVD